MGYGNVVQAARVVAVISPDSAPMKRLKDEARRAGKLLDATQGRRTRSILVTDSDHVILSALATETVAERLLRGSAPGDHDEDEVSSIVVPAGTVRAAPRRPRGAAQ